MNNGQVVFSDLNTESPAISDVFTRLASVMSGRDAQGDNMWRIYTVGSGGTVSVPAGGGR